MLLCHYNAAHYGAGELISDSREGSWRKASATWMFYFNAGPDRAALWQDAKQRAQAETAAWPYPWLDDAQFQPAPQHDVAGRLVFDKMPARRQAKRGSSSRRTRKSLPRSIGSGNGKATAFMAGRMPPGALRSPRFVQGGPYMIFTRGSGE